MEESISIKPDFNKFAYSRRSALIVLEDIDSVKHLRGNDDYHYRNRASRIERIKYLMELHDLGAQGRDGRLFAGDASKIELALRGYFKAHQGHNGDVRKPTHVVWTSGTEHFSQHWINSAQADSEALRLEKRRIEEIGPKMDHSAGKSSLALAGQTNGLFNEPEIASTQSATKGRVRNVVGGESSDRLLDGRLTEIEARHESYDASDRANTWSILGGVVDSNRSRRSSSSIHTDPDSMSDDAIVSVEPFKRRKVEVGDIPSGGFGTVSSSAAQDSIVNSIKQAWAGIQQRLEGSIQTAFGRVQLAARSENPCIRDPPDGLGKLLEQCFGRQWEEFEDVLRDEKLLCAFDVATAIASSYMHREIFLASLPWTQKLGSGKGGFVDTKVRERISFNGKSLDDVLRPIIFEALSDPVFRENELEAYARELTEDFCSIWDGYFHELTELAIRMRRTINQAPWRARFKREIQGVFVDALITRTKMETSRSYEFFVFWPTHGEVVDHNSMQIRYPHKPAEEPQLTVAFAVQAGVRVASRGGGHLPDEVVCEATVVARPRA